MAGVGDMVGGLMGGSSGGSNNLLGALMSLIQKRGGIQSALSQLQSGPMGDAVNLWTSTGPNKPVSSDDVGAAFSDESLDHMSQESGLPRDEVKSGLAAQLPAGPLAMTSETTISLPLAFAAGAVIASLADTLMPEAYENGGPVVALATTAGFALSYSLSLL